MSDASTTHMISAYKDQASSPMFLSSIFRTPEENYYKSEKVEIDIERDDSDIAIAVSDLSVGPHHNEATRYVNKSFTPPILDEAGSVNAFEAIKRSPGRNPFQDPDFMGAVVERMFDIGGKLERMIRRTIELMSSQVLQSGTVTLVNSGGTSLYTLDFQPKSTHFPTVSNDWGGGADDKVADLLALARVIHRDGHKRPDQLIFGSTALTEFLTDTVIQGLLDNRRINLGIIDPKDGPEGAQYYGDVWIGPFRFEIWSYDAEYRHPQTGNMTPYLGADMVVMRASSGRLDLSFGAIPSVVPPDQRVVSYLPERMRMPGVGLDLTPNVWVTPNNRTMMLSVGTRPLPIPTAIDTFGALDTVQ